MNKVFDEFMRIPQKGRKPLVIYITGYKGGIGKSVTAILTGYLASSTGLKVIYEDFDSNNDDVLQLTQKTDGVGRFIRQRDSWVEHLKRALHDSYDVMIVNMPAQGEEDMSDHGFSAISRLTQSGRVDVKTIFIITPFKDSVILLHDYLKRNSGEPVFVARQMAQAINEQDFSTFEKNRSKFDFRGGDVFNIPRMPTNLLEALLTDRKPLAQFIIESQEDIVKAFQAEQAVKGLDEFAATLGLENGHE